MRGRPGDLTTDASLDTPQSAGNNVAVNAEAIREQPYGSAHEVMTLEEAVEFRCES